MMIWLVVVLLLLVLLEGIGFSITIYMLYTKAEKETKKIRETISSLAKDVDNILMEAQYDSRGLTSVTSTNNEANLNIRTMNRNAINIGTSGHIYYDNLTDNMEIVNDNQNTSISMVSNSISLNPNLIIGNRYKLLPTQDNGLQVCDLTQNDSCKSILLA